ncbi:nucleotidyl transferase AbiEii/AbiGii toxin family protein [Candidatus Dojkabacteria bacterium]|uniref:Nucleotidyl transferase AbiEii/AbiGii toxin family protein n=1 Tax=Candidatus Dojkabacteria bacterium TaxID=2099670 RepID=A0A5C7J300_9BACT|nr:MAG: nucleotidyl transferase AbiEii/AbiGii toxin family protein [Candidatus Dojkabacteria bacterium]
MTKKDTKDVAHSVRARLLALARSQGRHNQDVLINYAMERFLYRLSLSSHAGNMVLKGALMLHVLEKTFLRATRDIDFLAFFANKKETITSVFKSILQTPVPNDGLIFDLEHIDIRLTQLDSKEMGAKVVFWASLGTAKLKLNADIGFGYNVVPEPYWVNYPSLLGDKHAKILGYTAESIVADKFESMVSRQLENSRMKDFYDMWVLANSQSFDNETLKAAILETFNYFDTVVPQETPLCFEVDFFENTLRKTQWNGFLKSAGIETNLSLKDAALCCKNFLMPLCNELHKTTFTKKIWLHDVLRWEDA